MRSKLIVLTVLSLLLLLLAACGGSSTAADAAGDAPAAEAGEVAEAAVSTGDPARGEELYNQTCIACHGPEGVGVEGLGKNLAESGFVHDQGDQALLEFVKTGRPISDPLNTTGIDMPPKGGNPALSDEQILDIIAYLRTLQ